MKRQDFYLNLTLELNERGVPPELINTHIEQFKTYLGTLSEDEAEKQIESFGSIKALADNIYKLLCGEDPIENRGEAKEDTVYDSYIVDELKQDELSSTDGLDADQILNDKAFNDVYGGEVSAPAETKAAENKKADNYNFDISNPDDYVKPDLDAFINDAMPAETAPIDDAGKEIAQIDIEKIYEENKNKIGKGSVLFWVLAVLTLPITLPLFVAVMALFGFTYVIISLLIAVTFSGIFVCAISGSAVTLSGMLYGVMQVRTGVFPIGIYEIGLALSVAGLTLLACILFYILSLQLLPKLYKYLSKLLKLFLNGLLSLIVKIQKECAAK